MKRVAVLGSTGSIGKNTLEVISHFPKTFVLESISAWSNVEELARQAKLYKPRKICLGDNSKLGQLKAALGSFKKLYVGSQGLEYLAKEKQVDIVVIAITGNKALFPLLAAIDSRKQIALANKEALVMAGEIIMQRAKAKNVRIIPVDSEASAIFQCLEGNDPQNINSVYLTASGGPLNEVSKSRFHRLKKSQILNHPRWKMGKKITVDCANLMNKGFELIETHWLFGIDVERIKVLIHQQAIIHSMVEFQDGSLLAQLGITDMKLPIQYALTYPQRLRNGLRMLDFYKIKNLSFDKPNFKKFPCLGLAYQAIKDNGSAPCVLSSADEEAVNSFLNDKLQFVNINKVIEGVLKRHKVINKPTLDELLQSDSWARSQARSLIAKYT